MRRFVSLILMVLAMLLPMTVFAAAGSAWVGSGPFATGLGNRVITALKVAPDKKALYAGTGSGTVFKYNAVAPTVATDSATNITSTGATLNGTANANFADAAVSFEYVTGSTLVATPAVITGGTSELFTYLSTGLSPDTQYEFWAVATNNGGTTYGNHVTFRTKKIQSIGFGTAPTVKVFGTGTVTVSAVPSGLTVALISQTTGTCTVSGTTVTGVSPGLCTIVANQSGDSSYDAAAQQTLSFNIAKADSITTVTCGPGPFTYDGSAQTPCSVSVTGAGGLSQSPAAVYASNTNAGTATASYSYAGDSNHNASSGSKDFTIGKASSTTVVTCPANVTYTGSALTPCSATVTGAGSLNLTPAPVYSNNTNAGTATASYNYADDGNHSGSSDSKNFTIDKADSTVSVTGATYYGYDGNPQGPDTVSKTGSTGAATFSYVGTGATTYPASLDKPTAAGTYTATATLASDSNYNGAVSAAKAFSITTARTVTTNSDSGAGSLRQTISDASPGDIIDFDPSVTGTVTLASTLGITKDLTINGPVTGGLTISGNNAVMVFSVDFSTTLNLKYLTIANGRYASPSSGTLTAPGGGGVYNMGTLNVDSCTFSDNTAVSNHPSYGVLGGAINNVTGTANISNSTFTGNSAISLTSSLGQGGAVCNATGTMTITNSTFVGNSAKSDGGAIYSRSPTPIVIVNSTISGNLVSASGGKGGGIAIELGPATLQNSIVADNSATIGSDIFGSFTSTGNNLVKTPAGAIYTPTTGDITGSDPRLRPLADNGGPTRTMALLSDSPAINAGACVTTTDQRGLARPVSGCDIGAYERGTAAALTADSGTPQTTKANSSFGNALSAKVVDSLGGTLDGVSVTFTGPASGAGITAGSPVNTNATGVAAFAASANGTAGGPYTVTATVGALSADFSLTNSKGDSTITATGSTTFTYNGSGQGPASASVTGSTSAPTYSYAGKGSTTYPASSVKPTAAGSYTVTASVAEDANYNGATSAPLDFTIDKKALIITATTTTSTYGTLPTVANTYNGLISDPSELTTLPTCVSTVTTTTPYAATAYAGANSCSGAAAANYSISYQTGSATVDKAVLTVTADNKTKIPGTVNPALTASYSGFVNSENATVVSGTAALATAATTNSPVGGYDITAAAGTLAAANYSFSFVKGTLTVAYSTTPPALTLSTLSDGATSSTGIINISGSATAINGLKSLTVNTVAVPAGSTGSFSYPFLLKPGSNSITVVATDNADLTTTVTRTITLDATAPLIRISGDITDNSVTSVAAHTISGNVFALDTAVTISLNGGTAQAVTLASGSDAFSHPVTLVPGLNTIEISATDAHGTSSSIKISTTLSTALTLGVTTPAHDIKVSSADFTLSGTVSGTGTPPLTVTVTMDGTVNTPALAGDGSFSQPLHFTGEKNYPVIITATDTSGNSATVLRNITYALLGDVNGSGTVTIEDAIKAYRIYRELDIAAGTDMIRLDVAPLDENNKPVGNGIINLGDVTILLRYLAGLVSW